jgi:predicted metal-dependent hydrolase
MDKQFIEAVKLFNKCKYHEAHDILEPLWGKTDEPKKQFYQGIIQAFVALHLIQEKRFPGAYKVFLRSKSNLEKYKADSYGVDLSQFLLELESIFTGTDYPNNLNEKTYLAVKIDFK